MAIKHAAKPSGPFSPQYINGVYIPSGLLLVGVTICKIEWLPYAAIVALLLGGYKVYENSEKFQTSSFE